MRENQMQTTIAECRRMYRHFVSIRYRNYSLGIAIVLGLAIAGTQIPRSGYWVKSLVVLAAVGVVAVDIFTAVALHGHFRSMMQKSEQIGRSSFAPSISRGQTVFLFCLAPATAFVCSAAAVVVFFLVF